MTAIWANDGERWKQLPPVPFELEEKLHDLIEVAPEMLPLSGTSELFVLGREVTCGSGSADLIGVEPSGRVVLIEVKLAKNAEARRAVVAQLLSYAAFVKGDSVDAFHERLRKHLHRVGKASVAEVVADGVALGFDSDRFLMQLAEGKISMDAMPQASTPQKPATAKKANAAD